MWRDLFFSFVRVGRVHIYIYEYNCNTSAPLWICILLCLSVYFCVKRPLFIQDTLSEPYISGAQLVSGLCMCEGEIYIPEPSSAQDCYNQELDLISLDITTDWLADWLTTWLTGWLIGWLSEWLTGWLTEMANLGRPNWTGLDWTGLERTERNRIGTDGIGSESPESLGIHRNPLEPPGNPLETTANFLWGKQRTAPKQKPSPGKITPHSRKQAPNS